MKMMMYFVTQLPGVWRTVLQISQKEKKIVQKTSRFLSPSCSENSQQRDSIYQQMMVH